MMAGLCHVYWFFHKGFSGLLLRNNYSVFHIFLITSNLLSVFQFSYSVALVHSQLNSNSSYHMFVTMDFPNSIEVDKFLFYFESCLIESLLYV